MKPYVQFGINNLLYVLLHVHKNAHHKPCCIVKLILLYVWLPGLASDLSQMHWIFLDQDIMDANWQIAHRIPCMLYTTFALVNRFGPLCFCQADEEMMEHNLVQDSGVGSRKC